ncbi:hypothetical protein EKK58_03035 [Candidatus Dependentiae bacterium]|nr:MAG: hypothetical protein EKK58_03035 [Candidatus Dependentiae bacterium]
MFFNSLILLSMELLTMGYLYPLFGMPTYLIIPTFIGWPLINIMVNLAYVFCMKYTLGAIYTGYGFMSYDLTLPLPIGYLITYYLLSFIIEASAATLPLLIIGLTLLSHLGISFQGSIILFCVLYILGLGLFASTFLGMSFWYQNTWFKNNAWTRRIGPLMAFGAIATPWFEIYKYSKIISYLMLLNPLTYLVEALRASLLYNGTFISLPICTMIIGLCYFITIQWLLQSMRRKLDLI